MIRPGRIAPKDGRGQLQRFLAIGFVLIGTSSAFGQQPTQRLPTATEVFNLRSQCAALGERILESNFIGSALTQSQVSHYEPRTNRCYVELTIQTGDMTKAPDYFNRVLFDGQTKEMLAVAQMKKGQKFGMVYVRQHRKTTSENGGFDDANDYINEMMEDDRK